MTTRICFGRSSIGAIQAEQIQSMLDRHQLGQLHTFGATDYGRMRQTLWIESTAGSFILKGNPFYSGQWIEEKFFIENLHQLKGIPVAVPYIVERNEDIFGWSYAVMPRLSGIHPHELLHTELSPLLLKPLADLLLRMHSWKVDCFGEFDPSRGEVGPLSSLMIMEPQSEGALVTERVPIDLSFAEWMKKRIEYWLYDAARYSLIDEQAEQYVKEQLEYSYSALYKFCQPVFVMGDYKSENILVRTAASLSDPVDSPVQELTAAHYVWDKENSVPTEMEVSGVFDFTTSYFGDPAADLVKFTLMWMKEKQDETASEWIGYYSEQRRKQEPNEEPADFFARLRIHIIYQLILEWGEAHATGSGETAKAVHFTDWIRSYVHKLDIIILKINKLS